MNSSDARKWKLSEKMTQLDALHHTGHLEQSRINQRSVEQNRVRHGLLVDKKFLEGLTKREAIELTQINHLLDASEEKYYAPIKETLAIIRASLEERCGS